MKKVACTDVSLPATGISSIVSVPSVADTDRHRQDEGLFAGTLHQTDEIRVERLRDWDNPVVDGGGVPGVDFPHPWGQAAIGVLAGVHGLVAVCQAGQEVWPEQHCLDG